MNEHAWSWIWPVLLTLAYAGLAVALYHWLIVRFRLKLAQRPAIWDDFIAYLLGWPVLALLALGGLMLLLGLWPLPPHVGLFLRNAESIAFIVLVMLIVQRMLTAFLRFSHEGSWLRITLLRKLALFILYTITTVTIMQVVLGWQITPILASLGVGSLAIALAVKDILANFFAGIQLAVDRPLEVGQFIAMENGMTGEVQELGWLKTYLRAEDGSRLIVPNARLLGFIIQNFTLTAPEAILSVTLAIDRASDLGQAEQIALAVAREVMAETIPESALSEPTAHYTKLSGNAAELTVRLGARSYGALRQTRSAYLKAVNAALAAAGINVV